MVKVIERPRELLGMISIGLWAAYYSLSIRNHPFIQLPTAEPFVGEIVILMNSTYTQQDRKNISMDIPYSVFPPFSGCLYAGYIE